MSSWERPPGAPSTEDGGRGDPSAQSRRGSSHPGGLEELRPERPEAAVPRWAGVLAGFVVGAMLIVALGGFTNLFDQASMQAESAALFDEGFAAGAAQARDEAESAALSREVAAFARGLVDGAAEGVMEIESRIEEAETRATRAAGAAALVLASEEREMGLRVGFDLGFDEGFEEGYKEAKRQAMALGVVLEDQALEETAQADGASG